MGLYNFQPRFVPYILDGSKTHTIRAPRKGPEDVPGNTMHLYTGLRRKGAKLLGRFECVRVEDIRIENPWRTPRGTFFAEVYVADTQLDQAECALLAKRDGFSSFAEMMRFWQGRLPFHGHIFHWRSTLRGTY